MEILAADAAPSGITLGGATTTAKRRLVMTHEDEQGLRCDDAAMTPLKVDVRGSGPPLLIPRCNFGWDEALLDAFAEHFTVVVAAPRGYGDSPRQHPPAGYDLAILEEDLLQACADAGFQRFAVFGYSFTGAVGLLLAQRHGQVDAVVTGGFPFAGETADMAGYVEKNLSQIQLPGSVEAVDGDNFDTTALLAIYRHIGTLPDASLINDAPCPVLAFWGSEDEILTLFGGVARHKAAAEQAGATTLVLEGLDHDGALRQALTLVPQITEWLAAQLTSTS